MEEQLKLDEKMKLNSWQVLQKKSGKMAVMGRSVKNFFHPGFEEHFCSQKIASVYFVHALNFWKIFANIEYLLLNLMY